MAHLYFVGKYFILVNNCGLHLLFTFVVIDLAKEIHQYPNVWKQCILLYFIRLTFQGKSFPHEMTLSIATASRAQSMMIDGITFSIASNVQSTHGGRANQISALSLCVLFNVENTIQSLCPLVEHRNEQNGFDESVQV